MNERALPSPTDADRLTTWQAELLARALDASVTPTRDLALGAGYRLTLTSGPIHVDLFPAGQAAQLVASDAHLLLIVAGQAPPIIDGRRIIFEGPGRSLSLAASGEIRLTITPEPTRSTLPVGDSTDTVSTGGGERP